MKPSQVKVLFKSTSIVRMNGVLDVKCTRVLYCLVQSETSRTYRTNRVGIRTYINGVKNRGLDTLSFKSASIKKRDPLSSTCLTDSINRVFNRSFDDAWSAYVGTLRDLDGEVLYFDRLSGEGMIRVPHLGQTFPVYACNLKGRKTWYPETACVYLQTKQHVKIERLAEVAYGRTAIVNEGVIFDAEKWSRLEHKSLAFRCDDDGNAVTGLFE